MTILHLLSGGAAQGLVTQLEERFETQHQVSIDACFGAVGMMRDNLLAGTPCDVLILTEALIAQLMASGEVVPGSAQTLGVVKTGVAVKTARTYLTWTARRHSRPHCGLPAASTFPTRSRRRRAFTS